MTRRRRIQLGLTAVATAIAVAVPACTGAPPGRTQYCSWHWSRATATTTTIGNVTTTTGGPTATTTTATSSTLAGPPTTIFDGNTYVGDLQCVDQPSQTVPTTLVGYPAPTPAGTRVVK